MSYTTFNQSFTVITNFTEISAAESALDEIINPIADAAVAIQKAFENEESAPESAQTDAAEEIADLLETTDFQEVIDYLKDSISLVRQIRNDDSIAINVATSSEEGISGEVFDGIIYPLAKLAKGNYSTGFYAEDDSRSGCYGFEWVITKDGDFHRMDKLAEIALAGI